MKLIVVILAGAIPIAAQQQRDFAEKDDKQAIAFYQGAVREQPNAGLFLNAKKEVQTCGLIVSYEQMNWLEKYSGQRTATLGKLGITPTSVNILKTSIAKRLAQNLVSRIKNNRPIKESCMYCICSGNICGTSGVDLSRIYQIGELLESIIIDIPAAGEGISLIDFHEPWKKSVIREAVKLKVECEKDMEYVEYGWECKILIKALAYGVDPSALKLTAPMTARLRSGK